jgi:hypothetical protein
MNTKSDGGRPVSGHKFRLWGFASVIVSITVSLIFAGSLYGQENATNGGNQPAARSLRAAVAAAASPATTMGAWTVPADLCAPDQICLIGGNAAVLATGEVLFYYYPPPGGTISNAVLLNPATGAVTDVTLPFAADIFCSGLAIMPNGQVLVTGGNLEGVASGHSGTFNTTIFNPFTSTWSTGQSMNYARWYPSTVELANGSMLELSGNNQAGTLIQNAMESYSYSANTWTALPTSANMPPSTLHWSSYPRMAVLPSGQVFLAAPDAMSYQFNPSTNVWSYVATTNFGARFYAPHVLLPGLQQVLVAGGSLVEGPPGGAATNTAEVINFSATTPAWSYTGSMTYARENENLVLLANGTVLAVGGGGGGGVFLNSVLTPELYNPSTGQWTLMAPQIVSRTYHSTAVLLPDGRVISAGTNDRGSLEQTYEIFSPPYLFNGARPTITAVPTSLAYAANFTITTPDAASIASVALIRPGATTHADDFDQRYVSLSFTVGSGQITATAPASGNYAPPGYYMVVILNSSGVPSVMRFVKLG